MKILRISSTVMLLSSCLLFNSCDSDEIQTADIVGVWTVSDADLEINIGGMSLVDYFVQELGLSTTEAQSFESIFELGVASGFTGTIEFKDDNTYVAAFGGDTEEGAWSISSGTMDLLILDEGTADESELIIKSVSSTQLVLSFEESESEDLDGDGVPEELTLSFTLTLTK